MANFFSQLPWLKKTAIGLEIGTSAIKIVELSPGSPPELLKAVSKQTPSGTMQDGQVVEPRALAEEIRSLLKEHNIKGKRVVATIANQSAVTRNIKVPVMERKVLNDSIRWEAERYIPFPLEDVILDYDLLDNLEDLKKRGEDQMELVIAAVPRDTVLRYVEVLKLAGLDPVAIDLKPFSALRALRGSFLGVHLNKSTLARDTYTEEGEVAVMLDIGASSTVIALVRGERLLMTRNINVAADDLTTAIQKHYDIDFFAAENVKHEYGAATFATEDGEDLLDMDYLNREDYNSATVHEILRSALAEMFTEVRRSLEFYRVQAGDMVIDRIYLSGGGAKLSGLTQAMSDNLGLYVELGNPWLVLNTKTSQIPPETLKEMGPEFAVPIGLALRGVQGID